MAPVYQNHEIIPPAWAEFLRICQLTVWKLDPPSFAALPLRVRVLLSNFALRLDSAADGQCGSTLFRCADEYERRFREAQWLNECLNDLVEDSPTSFNATVGGVAAADQEGEIINQGEANMEVDVDRTLEPNEETRMEVKMDEQDVDQEEGTSILQQESGEHADNSESGAVERDTQTEGEGEEEEEEDDEEEVEEEVLKERKGPRITAYKCPPTPDIGPLRFDRLYWSLETDYILSKEQWECVVPAWRHPQETLMCRPLGSSVSQVLSTPWGPDSVQSNSVWIYPPTYGKRDHHYYW
ncbi:uncharacterized protein VTP21DRAFT_139 [Calcarisporiella thermophila]|uniref:uncharacterized protein n=1 Tax=Calcarisporiella thermophila TaxID=911321 RepID=UPI0037425CEE